ncbi:MAG: hypothetical protein U9R27_01500 [Campylobacterota bacterium]|nr:hypothetical protein [Campylobacterota bacterium]
MTQEREETFNQYKKNLDKLYEEIAMWSEQNSLTTSSETIEISVDASERATLKKLLLRDENQDTIATLIPISAWVIGAKGRIDFVGTNDKAILVYLKANTPQSFFKNIDDDAWYWIEDKRRGKAYKLDNEFFNELLLMVSDYECN